MVIYSYPNNEKPNIPECVMALGFFDGVHIAHRDLISRAAEEAKARGLALGIFTFASDGKIKASSSRLYDDGEKAEMFDRLGADFTVFADFSAIAGSSPRDFVKKILVEDLNCRVCVAGFNFRFGKGAIGNSELLCRLISEYGGEAVICDEITAEGITLSATLIRGLISQGKAEEANRLLGAPYYIKGSVSHGRRDGRKLGFPTANVILGEGRTIPRFGVYRTAVVIDGKIYNAVSNIGVCPTFNGDETRLEAHIIDYSGDLYGKEICVYLLGFIREERRFESLEQLKMQINVDKNTTIRENGEITWQELGLK
jgi:riboflavin kinase/FMN adenylyltransferase